MLSNKELFKKLSIGEVGPPRWDRPGGAAQVGPLRWGRQSRAA